MEAQKNKKLLIREFGLSSLSINNRTSVVILTLLIVIMGVWSYSSMPKENFPEINIPTIYVGSVYPGNSPIDIENLITRPIEKEINSVSGVRKISSTSIQDFSTIIVEFNFDVDVTEALQEVKDAVDKAKANLPNDLDKDPDVFELDFAEIPIININISGENYTRDELKYYAEYLEDEIESLSEISKVDVRGAREKEVKVEIDRYKMESLKVGFGDIEQAIGYENMTISAGDVLSDEFRRSVRISGEFTEIDQIKDIIVKSEFQNAVYLRDIATVSFDYEEPKSFSRTSGDAVLTLDVKKRGGENILDAVDKIKVLVEDARENKFPSDLTLEYSNDTSRMTRIQLDNLENSIYSGITLVVLVLLFFLGLRNAMFVGVAIPLSMLSGFVILSFMGLTLNMVVLFSLILALGMLVDNGIVVVENIYRLMQEGKGAIQAAKEGVGEVAWPIIASTATTLAAFFPLIFWEDIMGEFMKYLPLTLIIVLASSLFVALVINPVLTSLMMKVQDENKEGMSNSAFFLMLVGFALVGGFMHFVGQTAVGNIFWLLAIIILLNVYILRPLSTRFQDAFLPRLELAYDRLIGWSLRGRTPVFLFIGMFGLMVASLMIFGASQPNVVNFPEAPPNYLNVFIEMPTGTDITRTNAVSKEIEQQVMGIIKNNDGYKRITESIVTNVGEGTTDPNSPESIGAGNTPHRAKITVSFVEFQFRKGVSTWDVMNDIREAVTQYPGVLVTVDKEANGPPVGPPINIEISGESFEELAALSEAVKTKIKNSGIEGIEELKSDLDIGKPEISIDVNRDAARTFGLSTAQIAGAIRTALFGKEVSKYKEGEDEFPIMLRLSDNFRYDIDALVNQKITFRDISDGQIKQVPISSVATVEYGSTYASVKRKDLDRVVTLYSNIIDGYNATNLVADLRTIFEHDFDVPEGYSISFTGEQEEQAKSMAFLGRAFAIALFLIVLILVSQFNSISTPLIIMFSVLFSTIGVFLGLAITGDDFVVIMTGIGIISLAGIVVNNAIVLIDYTNLVRERKREELGISDNEPLSRAQLTEAIMEGGKTRLRPVLLTAITTILGLIPLAVGFNINFGTLLSEFDPQIYIGGDNVVFWGPMSWTVIYGLIFATFLTLVIVPVMYLILDRLKYRLKRAVGS